MEAARPRRRRRRPRRGTVDRPLNARLVRVSALIVVPAILAVLFSVSETGTLPRPGLEPLFDSAAAASLATQLSAAHPSRIPGTIQAEEAALWFAETISAFGFATEEDIWTEDLAGLGRVELRNVVAVVPGRSSATLVLVAHRDNAGTDLAYGDNASGTAALIELARGFAPRGAAVSPRPERTLVLVSTDGGAFGGAGARRFAEESPYAEEVFAAIVLDGVGGTGRPAIAIAGDEPRSPAPALVSTAKARIREQIGREPATPGVLTQLVDLAIPFAAGEQGRLLASGIAAITLTTEEPADPRVPVGDAGTPPDVERLGELGRATEALVGSIDASVGAAFRTPDSIFLGDRVASGWAVRLALLVACVPFALGALDLLVRARRRGLPLASAARSLRTRLLFWLYAGLLLWLGALVGLLPTGAALPPPPYASFVSNPPVAGLALLALAVLAGWLVGRRRIAARALATAEERLAGHVVALAWLAIVAVLLGLFAPYALVFVLPSLYAWLWLPLRTRPWARAGLFVLGLSGPALGLLLLSSQLGLDLWDTVLYVGGLVTTGYVSPAMILFVVGWTAAAGQFAALAFGRYGPYAGGAEPPAPGAIRDTVRALAQRSRVYARSR